MSNPQLGLRLCRWVLGVARAIFGEEPKKDPRPWVRGCENELVTFDQAVTQASCRKRRRNLGMIGGRRIVRYDVASDDARRG